MVSKSLQPWVENNITSKLDDLNLEDLELLLKSNEMKELIGKKDKASEEENVTITERLKEVLPENVSNLLEEYGVNAKDIFKNVKIPDLNFNASNVKDQALSIIKGIIVTASAKIVHAAVFVAIEIALLIVLNIINLLLNPLFDKLPVVGTLNRFGGLLFGIIEAVLIIWLVIGIIKTFNILDIAEIAKGTYLLKFFLNVSIKTLLSIV
ncbi:MAG: CvpA family protein [Clostridia bacterium]|nr:CvpA family protein [Clostridia bacterium]